MIDSGMLFFAYFAVRLRDCAKMVGCGPSGQMAVVSRVLALANVEFFAENDVASRRPVAGRQAGVQGAARSAAAGF